MGAFSLRLFYIFSDLFYTYYVKVFAHMYICALYMFLVPSMVKVGH